MGAALQWWQMAGVDCDFADDATDWLGELGADDASPMLAEAGPGTSTDPVADQTATGQLPNNQPERVDLLGNTPPQDLAAFRQWWLETPGLDAIGPRGRVAPRGPANADLMILTVDPEQRDRDHLLSGPRGQLLSAILAAMGVSEEKTYIASALPRHTPMADTENLAAGGMDAVTLHHIKLASPQRLIALGKGILPLLGQDVGKTESHLREINQNTRKVPILVSEGLDSMMAMPRLKAQFWRRLIEWTAD